MVIRVFICIDPFDSNFVCAAEKTNFAVRMVYI